jgi:hypothetical protein
MEERGCEIVISHRLQIAGALLDCSNSRPYAYLGASILSEIREIRTDSSLRKTAAFPASLSRVSTMLCSATRLSLLIFARNFIVCSVCSVCSMLANGATQRQGWERGMPRVQGGNSWNCKLGANRRTDLQIDR